MTREGSTFARRAMRRMVVASRPRSPNSARAASRMRCAVAARLAALLPGSLTPFTLPLLSQWCTVGSTNDERGAVWSRMKIIAIEEHWNSVSIRDALDRLQGGARDESVAFNTMGDNHARLEDIGQGRVETMDAAGIDVSILSVVTPATQALPAADAIALAREANDEASDAVRAHPARFRAFATLPTSDPQAAAAELERCARQLGHVGAMVHGRTGTRTLDDPAYDDLFATAARLRQPIFIHPQIPSKELRDAAYRGL